MIQRREFLKAAAAIASSAAIPAGLPIEQEPLWLKQLRETGVLFGQDITLHKTLVISAGMGDVFIGYNTFRMSENFVGDTMVEMKSDARGRFCYNTLCTTASTLSNKTPLVSQ